MQAATASILIATAPLITALEARLLFGEKLKGSQWFAILLEFAGVAVLTLLNGDLTVNAGLVWLLLAAFSLSIYNLLQRRLTKTYSAMQTTSYSIFFGTALLAVFAPGAMKELAGLLHMKELTRMEAYDISNISGFANVGSMVVYENGKPKRSDYRKFRIKSVAGPNDYACMREVLTRRFRHGLEEQREMEEKNRAVLRAEMQRLGLI